MTLDFDYDHRVQRQGRLWLVPELGRRGEGRRSTNLSATNRCPIIHTPDRKCGPIMLRDERLYGLRILLMPLQTSMAMQRNVGVWVAIVGSSRDLVSPKENTEGQDIHVSKGTPDLSSNATSIQTSLNELGCLQHGGRRYSRVTRGGHKLA